MKNENKLSQIQAEAEKLYPYLPNEDNDLATREWNQKKHDQREAYVEGSKFKQFEHVKTFEEAVEPIMKWLAENQHPHTTVIATSNKAELVEGLKTHLTDKFIID